MQTPIPNSQPPRYVPALSFHALTRHYDAVVEATTREQRFKQALLAQAAIQPGQAILDAGCGTGTLACMIKAHQPMAEISGVDGDPAILEMARAKTRSADLQVQFDCALASALPYPDASFDRALSSLFFHHLSPDEKPRVAAELFRVLKPGGELHVADWGRPGNLLMRGLFLQIQLLDGFANTAHNIRGQLITLFEEAGFAAVTQRQSFGTMFGSMALYSAIKPA